jgi:hypothetical protein
MRRPSLTPADEPLTFEPEATHPLAGWMRSASEMVRAGTPKEFPSPTRKMTPAEAESAFHFILGLTGRVSVHQTATVWNEIWSHWDASWGHAQQHCLAGGAKRLWMDQFFAPAMLERYGTPHAIAAWLRQDRLLGPGLHVWPKATCLSSWSETRDHWAYQALLAWHRVHQPKEGGRADEQRAIPARRQAWNEVMDIIDAKMAQVEHGWEWPSHWRIWHAQERSFMDPDRVEAIPADLPPVDRPTLSVKGFSDQSMFVSLKKHWAQQIARGWKYNDATVTGKMEAGKKYLLFAENAPGDAAALSQMVQALSGNPPAKAQWERLLLAATIESAVGEGVSAGRSRRRL